VLHQFPWVEAGVGDVAPATARNLDFLEDFPAFFQNNYLRIGVALGGTNGCKETGSAATDNQEIAVCFCRHCLKVWVRFKKKWRFSRSRTAISLKKWFLIEHHLLRDEAVFEHHLGEVSALSQAIALHGEL
jgi:hypothetical protein